MNTIYLYTTFGCHLCEQAEAIVVPYLKRYDARLALTEIADSDDLMQRYGVRIPVLKSAASDIELGWPFTEADAQQWLHSLYKAV